MLIHWKSAWLFVWRGAGQEHKRQRRFEGEGAALIFIPPYVSHAIANEGSHDLWITAVLDGSFDPNAPDIVPDDVL